jgi:MFS transporter, CP family, cyanate transporter
VLRRTHDVAQTGRLSATAQSIGCLIAATGPLAVGLLHEATGDCVASLALLLVAVSGQMATGVARLPQPVPAGAGRPRISPTAW